MWQGAAVYGVARPEANDEIDADGVDSEVGGPLRCNILFERQQSFSEAKLGSFRLRSRSLTTLILPHLTRLTKGPSVVAISAGIEL